MSLPSETKAEAVLQLRYVIRLHQLHRRLYRRVEMGMSFASIVAGSAALLPVWQQMPGGLMLSGIALAIIGAISAVGGLAEAAAQRNVTIRQLNRALERAADAAVSAAEIDAANLASESHVDIEALRYIAYNDVLRAGGHTDGMQPETPWQRVMRAVA
jgi:hypothetical protein